MTQYLKNAIMKSRKRQLLEQQKQNYKSQIHGPIMLDQSPKLQNRDKIVAKEASCASIDSYLRGSIIDIGKLDSCTDTNSVVATLSHSSNGYT